MGQHRKQPAGRSYGDGKPGYKNISKDHQWKKGGPSPNPEGRRAQKPPSMLEEIHRELVGSLRDTIDVGDQELTHLNVMIRRMMSGALNDPKASLKTLIAIVDLLKELETRVGDQEVGVGGADEALIAGALRRLARRGAPTDV